MKKIVVLFLVSVMSLPLMASGGIKGTIVDAGDQSPLDFVNVALFKQGSQTPVAGVATDNKGVFSIPSVANGKYSLRISYVGYTTVNKSLEIVGSPLNLGTIQINEDSKSLKEVEVVAQSSQMRFDIDKKVFSVDQNIAAAGGSASDVLKNIPSVSVDNDGNVSLRKDGNVEVWINGKASGLTADNRAQVLQQLPAESIESVEIMTNPSAKFNPEGSAGIINIVMKQNRKAGYYGSVSAGVTYPDGGKLGGNLGASINFSSSKFDSYINLGYRNMSFNGGGNTNRTNFNGTDSTLLNQHSTMSNSFSGIFMRAGVDYHLDKKNTIGLSGFGMSGSGNSGNNSGYLLTNLRANPASVLRNYNRSNNGTGTRPSLNLSLDYRHEFDKKGTNLNASMSYSYHNRTSDNTYLINDALASANNSNISQSTDGKNKGLEFKVDYTNKLTDNSKLEAGWQSNINNTLSISDGVNNLANAAIPSYYDNFDYKEQIHAGYLTYGNRINKLSYQIGLRAEYLQKESTNTTKSTVNSAIDTVQTIPAKTLFHVFPSLYLSYNLANNAELQLNYTNRVNRPRGQQINPYRNLSDSTNISYGNPDLIPQYASAMELNYIKSWEAQSLSASIYYRSTDNVIQNVRFLHNGVMESTFMNIAKSQNTGLELISKNRLFKILNLTSSVNVYYSKLDAATYINPYNTAIQTTIPGQDNFSWSANVLANFMLSKTLSGQISGEYESPQLIAQGKQNEMYTLDLGLRKTFMDRKLSISVNIRDILNSASFKSTTSGSGFYQTSSNYFHGRMFGLTASYNFGTMKAKKTDQMKKKEGAGDMQDMNMEGVD